MGGWGFSSGTVTLLFAEVEGSIELWGADRKAMAEASNRHNHLVRDGIGLRYLGEHRIKDPGALSGCSR